MIEFYLLGRKAGNEQRWSSHDKTVRQNSSTLDVETDDVYASNNGRIIRLNCGYLVKEHILTWK